MTLSAERVGERNIKVRTTYGPITNEVTEDASHVRSFMNQLDRLVKEVEEAT